jgi:hypothetical protein
MTGGDQVERRAAPGVAPGASGSDIRRASGGVAHRHRPDADRDLHGLEQPAAAVRACAVLTERT